MMKFVLEVLVGLITLFPFIVSMGLVLLFRKLKYKYTVRKIADYTTPFLFLSVYIIAYSMVGDGVGFIIATIAILLVLVFAIIEKRRQPYFSVINLFRRVWRLYFLILTIVYLLLIIIRVILTINERMSV